MQPDKFCWFLSEETYKSRQALKKGTKGQIKLKAYWLAIHSPKNEQTNLIVFCRDSPQILET